MKRQFLTSNSNLRDRRSELFGQRDLYRYFFALEVIVVEFNRTLSATPLPPGRINTTVACPFGATVQGSPER